MTLKTFNIDDKTYKEYSKFCKEQGISMSKQIERFIENEIEKIRGAGKKLYKKETKKDNPVLVHSFQKYC